MATVNTNDLRIKNSKNLIESFNGPNNEALSYVFVGRTQAWTDDNVPPVPQNNNKDFYTTYDNMISLKRINTNLLVNPSSDAFHMISRVRWTSGVVYDLYKHNYSLANRSYTNASNLYDAKFIVINQSNNVFVCLDNNNNSQSTVEPQQTGNDPFFTSDGYQWLRIYNLTSDDVINRSTENFIPIITYGDDADLTTGIDGAVYTTVIDTPGNDFTVSPPGAVNQVPAYYCRVLGDGTGAVAKVTIFGGRVSKIEMVSFGSGYTYGTLNFKNGHVYESEQDLTLGRNALNPGGDGTFRSTVIISPPGGWGTDLPRELGGTKIGVFSDLNYPQYDANKDVSFRQIGILQDANVGIGNPDDVNACYAIKLNNINTGTVYGPGETIIQERIVDDEVGNSVTKEARGIVVSWDPNSSVLRYVQNSTTVDADGQVYRFAGQRAVVGLTTGKSEFPDIDFTGTASLLTFTTGYATPTIEHYSGSMTYLANISPVVRSTTQNEKISIVIAF